MISHALFHSIVLENKSPRNYDTRSDEQIGHYSNKKHSKIYTENRQSENRQSEIDRWDHLNIQNNEQYTGSELAGYDRRQRRFHSGVRYSVNEDISLVSVKGALGGRADSSLGRQSENRIGRSHSF